MAKYNVVDFLTPVSIVAVAVLNFTLSDWINVAKISDQYFTALTPASYAFSIWLVIWGVQLTAVFWLLYRPDESDVTKRKRELSQTIGPYWIIGAILEITWLFLFGAATRRTFAAAAVALVYATFAFTQALFAIEPPEAPKVLLRDFSGLVGAGTAINAAWLSVASAVSILTFLPYPTEQVELAAVLLACLAGIGLWVSIRTCSIAYPLTLVWALVAVVLVADRARSIRVLAALAAGIFAFSALLNIAQRLMGSVQYSKKADDQGDVESGG